MTIVYTIGDSLYLNITNNCPNACEFCIRSAGGEFPYSQESLWLTREPTLDEITGALFAHNLSHYEEVVFCGFGEPLERFDDVCEICRQIRLVSDVVIRINTNGLSDLINQRPTAAKLEGLVDVVSISLNAANAWDYCRLCNPVFGDRSYDAVLQFARDCIGVVPTVVLTVLDLIGEEQIAVCEEIARGMGANFRVRTYIGGGES